MLKANRMFREVYQGGANFMTPRILRRGLAGAFAWELSEGRGMGNQKIWGVTVLQDNGAGHPVTKRTDLSGCYQSLGAAQEAIDNLATQEEQKC